MGKRCFSRPLILPGECYNHEMFDDDPSFEAQQLDQINDEFSAGRSRPNCLFLAISLLLIVSLIGTSIATYFVIARAETRRPPTETGIDRSITAVQATGPTAAPATVVAAAPTIEVGITNEERETSIPLGVNRIALLNENGQVETIAPDGEDRRVLTSGSRGDVFQFPAWSPDGRRLAVIGSRQVGGGIYVLQDVAGDGLVADNQIYYNADRVPFYLYWSPDGGHVAFLANHSRNTMGLNVVASDGKNGSRLLATGTPFYWDWTEDGRRLLIHSGRERARNTLALIDIEGEPQAENLATPGDFQAPDIGRGGRYWAFAEATGDGLSSLAIIDTQTGDRRSYKQGSSIALSWNPEGDQIAFTNGAVDGHPYWGPLHLLDVGSGEIRLLSTQTVLAFFWSPDGRFIAFITFGRDRRDDGVNVSVPEKTSGLSRVGTSPAQQSGRGFLTLSVIEVATGQGLRLLDFEPTALYLSQFLPFFDQYALSHRIWSPDSSALVLPVREDRTNLILVIPVEGGRPYRLAEGSIAFWSPR